jgi:hypothetical protein
MNDNDIADIDSMLEQARRRSAACNYIVSIGDKGATYHGPFSSQQQLLAYADGANWGSSDWRAVHVEDPHAPLPVITPPGWW